MHKLRKLMGKICTEKRSTGCSNIHAGVYIAMRVNTYVRNYAYGIL